MGRNEVRRNQKDVNFWHLWYQTIKGTGRIERVSDKTLILIGMLNESVYDIESGGLLQTVTQRVQITRLFPLGKEDAYSDVI
ncbi:hypothetical protein ACLOJK_026795 [Asimina triloba]